MVYASPAKKEVTVLAQVYFENMGKRNWDKVSSMTDPAFLGATHRDYVVRVEQGSSMREEVALLKQAGVKTIDELKSLNPYDFYSKIQKYRDNHSLTAETKKRLIETSKVKILGAIEETPFLVHIVARSSQRSLKEDISELVFVSFEKREKIGWVVAPQHQKVQMRKIKY